MEVSAVAAALQVITNDPAHGTTLFTKVRVASAVLIVVNMILLTVTNALVTVTAACHAAIFTVPAGLSMVWFPVVKAAVIVLKNVGLLYLPNRNSSMLINWMSVSVPGVSSVMSYGALPYPSTAAACGAVVVGSATEPTVNSCHVIAIYMLGRNKTKVVARLLFYSLVFCNLWMSTHCA